MPALCTHELGDRGVARIAAFALRWRHSLTQVVVSSQGYGGGGGWHRCVGDERKDECVGGSGGLRTGG